jgi:cytochrome c oxidase subunit 1/cytochrome c oxidase subunit I+III
VGTVVLGVGILVGVWNLASSLRAGPIAGKNPWNADTLEWATESPPSPYAFVRLPTVAGRHPLWDEHDEEGGPDEGRLLDHGRQTVASTWLDARPDAVAVMPEDSVWPLLTAVALGLLFTGLLLAWAWLAVASTAAVLVCLAAWMWPRGEEAPA